MGNRVLITFFERLIFYPKIYKKWLKDAGFFPSDQISVKVEKQKLVIEMVGK